MVLLQMLLLQQQSSQTEPKDGHLKSIGLLTVQTKVVYLIDVLTWLSCLFYSVYIQTVCYHTTLGQFNASM